MNIHFHFILLSSIFITLLCISFVAVAFAVFFPAFVSSAGRPSGLYFIQDDTFTIKSSMIIIIIMIMIIIIAYSLFRSELS